MVIGQSRRNFAPTSVDKQGRSGSNSSAVGQLWLEQDGADGGKTTSQ
ncbi:MAG: hypothetical protein GY820_10270 [Gammaproteobacteria bacterium]|nr:hypothetical protein [Gammaproteobacteria bacterium]